jgi:TctA family transporter
MEANLRRALIVSEGSMGGAFFNSTLSSILLIAAFASIALSIARGVISSRKSKTSAAA